MIKPVVAMAALRRSLISRFGIQPDGALPENAWSEQTPPGGYSPALQL